MSLSVEQLMPFCDQDMPGFEKPWSSQTHTYASDGRCAVRVPRIATVEIANVKRSTDLDGMFAEALLDAHGVEHVNGWARVPHVEWKMETCLSCNGKPDERRECPECEGMGCVEWQHGNHTYEADCQECDGFGDVGGCRACDDKGVIEPPTAFTQIGDAKYNNKYLALFCVLPDCEIRPRGPMEIGALRFTGGHGILMPMRA